MFVKYEREQHPNAITPQKLIENKTNSHGDRHLFNQKYFLSI
jgi:hypothetical protein